MELAERIDSLRIAPRLVLFGYGSLFMWYVLYTTIKYFHMPTADRTMNVTAYVGGTFATLAGLAGLVYKIYADGGRDWDTPNQPNSGAPRP
jgi:hypothetical protein